MAESSIRIIKKYPNRRLYDTRISGYITLADVKALVMAFEEFSVVDAKTGEDLTRGILLQIILEEESGGMPLFSSELLAHMIRFYGTAMQGMMGQYLENNIKSFADFQKQFCSGMQPGVTDASAMQNELWSQFLKFQAPVLQKTMSAYMEQSQALLAQMQSQLESQTRGMFNGFPFPGATGDKKE